MENQDIIPKEAPQGLKVLCVLTFIYTGIVGFFVLIGMLFAKPLFQKLEESYATLSATEGISEKQMEQVQAIINLGSGSFIIICGVLLLILGLSFFGALQMWQLKSKGFTMYLIANCILLAGNITSLQIFMAVIDVLFIVLYYRQIKALEKAN